MEDPSRRRSNYISLRDAMNELFEGSVVSPRGSRTQNEGITPPVDVHETDEAYTISMAVPGVNPDDINISVQGRTITVSGQVERHWQQEHAHVHYREIETGRFSRSFTLGNDVDVDQTEASFQNGILTLTLPKAQAAKPRQIRVSTGQETKKQSGNVPIQGEAEEGSETRL